MTTTKPHLTMLCGIPASGKSTYAAALRAKRPEMAYICPDVLRGELDGDQNDQRSNARIFSAVIPALMQSAAAEDRDILFDATNGTRKNRRGILEQAKALGYSAHAIVFHTPLEVCLARNAAREKRVPDEVIHRMHLRFHPPVLPTDPELDFIECVPYQS